MHVKIVPRRISLRRVSGPAEGGSRGPMLVSGEQADDAAGVDDLRPPTSTSETIGVSLRYTGWIILPIGILATHLAGHHAERVLNATAA